MTLCFSKYHTLKTTWVWQYNLTHFEPCHYVKMSDQRHVPAAYLPGKDSPLDFE